jgi:RNA polymerase sigma-70 factor (ECF subfamily)
MEDTAAPEQLMARVASERDRHAFSALFRAYAPRLKGFFQRGGAASDAADELVQEVMLRVWRSAATYAPARGSVDTWIFRIARNARAQRGQQQRYEIALDDPALVPAPSPSPEELTERTQNQQTLHAALDALPAEQADLVRAVYFGAKTIQAVADEQALPLGTAKSRLRLGFQRLREALGHAGS